MAWNAGSRLFRNLIEVIQDNVDDESVRVEIYREMIDLFETMDCENLKELYEETDDAAYDTAYHEYDDE
jgi:hypothetical protein